MISFDPVVPEMNVLPFKEEGWSVEEVARINKNAMSQPHAADMVAHGQGMVEATAKSEAQAEPASAAMATASQIYNTVSGRYRGRLGNSELELRVDIDGQMPMQLVSGDFFSISGNTVSYVGSFYCQAKVQISTWYIIIDGQITASYSTNYPKVRVTIARTVPYFNRAPAYVQFFTANNQGSGTYVCNYESAYFRTVEYEQDVVQGVTPFTTYDTGSLPSGGPRRVLSVARAYEEAGIQLLYSGSQNIVPISGAGANLKWSNAELHAAMIKQFSLWREMPQWKVWLLAAGWHEESWNAGMMFDVYGRHRQGCAVFHQHAWLAGSTPDKIREQLFAYVHELGHCFNLSHSFQKHLNKPPQPSRWDALSWMHYPDNYVSVLGAGRNAFWANFGFTFDAWELSFLRHAFRDSIIMGGHPVQYGAGFGVSRLFEQPLEDGSGLELELEAKKSFALGEPVVIEIKLRTTNLQGQCVHGILHPNYGFVTLAIQKPNGDMQLYRPFIQHCAHIENVKLDAERPAIYESAYIGYGKDGFYFDQVGIYRIRALYHAPEGSRVVSDTLSLRVRAPFNAQDDEVAELYLGDDQGQLLYLLGSDSEFLKSGNDAFELMLDKHGDHPLAVYARMVAGINASREFKTITSDKKLGMRKPQYEDSIALLSEVVDASEKGVGVDNITLNMTMRCLARTQKSAGDEKAAKATMTRMVDLFRKKSLKPHVLRHIEAQAKEI